MKPRSDSKLKTLPEDRQVVIAEYARGHSLEETVKWLSDDGLKTSAAALSEFLSWFQLRSQLQRNESTVESLLKNLQQTRPAWTPDQIDKAGQDFFSALAIEQQDSLTW